MNASRLHTVPVEDRGSRSRSAFRQLLSILVVGPVWRCGQPPARPCAFCEQRARLSKWLRATAAQSRAFSSDNRAVVRSHASVHRPGRASRAWTFLGPSGQRNVRGETTAEPPVAIGGMIHSLPLFCVRNLQPAPSRSRRTSTPLAILLEEFGSQQQRSRSDKRSAAPPRGRRAPGGPPGARTTHTGAACTRGPLLA
jgi:hypothetical protein